MIGKEFSVIVREDIEALAVDGVQEGTTIDYKAQLPSGSDEEVREFLSDVSSFANASGGDLIYGVSEKQDGTGKATGLPDAPKGLAGVNADQQINRMENWLRDGIDPRIPGIKLKAIEGFSEGPVIVLRVPKSWSSPHMVKFRNLSRFYSRNSAGKYQLDVREIRALMLSSESLEEHIASFKAERISRILGGETPVAFEPGPKLLVHLLPIRAFLNSSAIDLQKAAADWQQSKVVPPGNPTSWGPPLFNFQGLYIYGGHGDKPVSYIQLFRNGSIEVVLNRVGREKLIFGIAVEQDVFGMKQLVRSQSRLERGPPLVVAVTLLSVKGLGVFPRAPQGGDFFHFVRPIAENVLMPPDALIQDAGVDWAKQLRFTFDALWQASGWPGSQGYDESGNWVGFKRWLPGM
jgi:hypothetical protein